jgi:hypothetical protein
MRVPLCPARPRPARTQPGATSGHAWETGNGNEHFFQVYKDLEGHKVSTEGFEPRASAERVIAEARSRADDR